MEGDNIFKTTLPPLKMWVIKLSLSLSLLKLAIDNIYDINGTS